MRDLFLGVDAGNTKTLAMVCDDRGVVLGTGRDGLGDIYGAARPEDAVEAVASTVEQALGGAGAQPSDVCSTAFRLAGIDWPEDEAYWRAALQRRFAALAPASVKNDGFALLRCGDLSGVGVAIAAGTGLAVAGHGPGDQEFALCWWCQDYLGGAGLGSEALRAVFLAELGMGPESALTAALLEVYAAADAEALLKLFTRREKPLGHQDRSRAAFAVLQVAADGDDVSSQILNRHGALLADYAILVARKVGLVSSPLRVVLGGSVLTSDHAGLRDRVVVELARQVPSAAVTLGAGPPVVGAVLDALAEGGISLTVAVRDRVLSAILP